MLHPTVYRSDKDILSTGVLSDVFKDLIPDGFDEQRLAVLCRPHEMYPNADMRHSMSWAKALDPFFYDLIPLAKASGNSLLVFEFQPASEDGNSFQASLNSLKLKLVAIL